MCSPLGLYGVKWGSRSGVSLSGQSGVRVFSSVVMLYGSARSLVSIFVQTGSSFLGRFDIKHVF